MIKILLTISLLLSGLVAAQENKYEPVANKAEYYALKYLPGKDYSDLKNWVLENQKKVLSKTDAFDNFEVVLFTPQFGSDLTSHDAVFLGLWPSATEMYKGMGYWIKNGGSQAAKIPVATVQAVDTWQWAISAPEGERDIGAVRFADCKMKEGVNGNQVFDAYKDFAIAAKKTGDNLGRKMIFPGPGATEGDYDYVYSLYARTVEELGSGADNYWQNINGSKEDQALNELIESCSNYRIYITEQIL